jgi:hypothetical protein
MESENQPPPEGAKLEPKINKKDKTFEAIVKANKESSSPINSVEFNTAQLGFAPSCYFNLHRPN